MSYVTLLVAAGCLWLATGLVLGFVMGRRGHDAFSWFLTGAVFGPLALVSTATELARTARVPVLTMGAGDEPVSTGTGRTSRAKWDFRP